MIVNLPAGKIPVYDTIVSGGDSSGNAQVALSFVGAGPSLPYAWGNNGAPGGTTLVWMGEPGGTMWKHAGGAYPKWEGMTFQMDPGNEQITDARRRRAVEDGYPLDEDWRIFDGSRSAGIGLQIHGDNQKGGVTQSPYLSRVCIIGSRDIDIKNTPRFTIGLYISAGDSGHAQVDNIVADSLEVRDVFIGVYSYNWQAVCNEIRHGKLDARYAALLLRRGSMNVHDTQFNIRSDNGSAIVVGEEAAYLRVRDSYCEMPTAASFMKVGGTDTQRHHNFLGNIVIDGGRFNHQYPDGGALPIVEGEWEGTVTMTNCDLKTSIHRSAEDAWFTIPSAVKQMWNNVWSRTELRVINE